MSDFSYLGGFAATGAKPLKKITLEEICSIPRVIMERQLAMESFRQAAEIAVQAINSVYSFRLYGAWNNHWPSDPNVFNDAHFKAFSLGDVGRDVRDCIRVIATLPPTVRSQAKKVVVRLIGVGKARKEEYGWAGIPLGPYLLMLKLGLERGARL